MQIPNDSGGIWRRNKLLEYIGAFPDEIGPLMQKYFNKEQFTQDDKVWWILLYSACYCMGSACILQKELDFRTVNKQQLDAFWANNKHRLIFQSDRRYIKNMNQFNDIVKEFIRRSKRRPWQYLSQFIRDSPEATYHTLYKEVTSWKYYGRFGTILFLYNINKLLGIPMDSDSYDWKNGSTTTSAIFNAFYMDERADSFEKKAQLCPGNKEFLDSFLQKLVRKLKKTYPNKIWTILGVTSDLCSYRKLFKQTRYLGYYVDRQQEELQWLQNHWPEYDLTWERFWKWRKLCLDHTYLGELNGWSGIQKERMTAWVERGEFK